MLTCDIVLKQAGKVHMIHYSRDDLGYNAFAVSSI